MSEHLEPQHREYLKSLVEARQVLLRAEVKRMLADKHGTLKGIRDSENELLWTEKVLQKLENK
jgi:hypothetical protein